MDKRKGEVSGAKQVQQCGDNEKRSVDTALVPGTIQLWINGHGEDNCVAP
jgi:hypothetical protein